MHINVKPALFIHGWTSEKELVWLATQAARRRSIVEIGSWRGRSAFAMAYNTTGEVLAVDTWNGTPEDNHGQFTDGKDPDWLYREFINSTSELKNVRSMRGSSTDISTVFSKPFADMIFIDGDHSYEAVKADILAWKPLLIPGGLLCGHDFDGGRPGVIRAVKELIPNVRMAGAGSIWVSGAY